QLTNLELEAAIAESQGKIETLRTRLEGIEALTHAADRESRDALFGRKADAIKMLETAEQQLEIQLRDQERLTLRAPRSGVVIPHDRVPEPSQDRRELPTWWGTPFDARNLGATIEAGSPFCWVGDPTRLEARM